MRFLARWLTTAIALALPVTILTLGLFIFVINAGMLGLTSWVSGMLFSTSRFVIDGVVAALLSALVFSSAATLLSWMLIDD